MKAKKGPPLRGDVQLLQAPRGFDGRLRVGRWDRGMTFGDKMKDGIPTVFSVETFGQMIDNWKRRGEKLAYCYNHQSAYVEQNGQPAVGLAFANAVAVVADGEVVRFEKLLLSDAQPPDVAELQRQVMQLATDENPQPTPDGCWWYRSEHTPAGESLLPTFAFLSPMFVTDGQDEKGDDVGYVIFDLAATNTPFQAGCVISFERASGRLTMAILSNFKNGDRVRVQQEGALEPYEGVVTDARQGTTITVRCSTGPYAGEEREVKPEQLLRLDGADPEPQQMAVTVSQLVIGDVLSSNEGKPIGKVSAVGTDRVLVATEGGEEKWFTGHDLANLHKMQARTRQENPMKKKLLATFAALMKVDASNRKQIGRLYSRKIREAQATLRLLEAKRMAKAMGKEFDAKEFEDDAAEMKRFEEEGPTVASPDDGIGAMASKLEEMAKHYEDIYEEDEGEDDQPHHVVMRKLAKHFRRLAKLDMDDVGEPPTQMEEEDEKAVHSMAQQLGLASGARLRDIAVAMSAKTAPLSTVGQLEQKIALLEKDSKDRSQSEKKTAGQLFAQKAVDEGRTTKEKVDAVVAAYVDGGEKKAEDLLFARGTFTILRRIADDKGNPIGAKMPPVEYAHATGDEVASLYTAKLQKIVHEKRAASMSQAAPILRSEDPALYQAYAATRRR